jgi:Class II Aldolase and Adducin N-terminal domain
MRYVDDAGACVLAAAKDMLRRGLVEGTAGIISARQLDGTVVITPAAIDYADMELADLVVLTSEGRPRAAKDGRSPSSERMLYLACYRAGGRPPRHRSGGAQRPDHLGGTIPLIPSPAAGGGQRPVRRLLRRPAP